MTTLADPSKSPHSAPHAPARCDHRRAPAPPRRPIGEGQRVWPRPRVTWTMLETPRITWRRARGG
eukprot:1646095-Pyramimonas_sp.AAC.1